MFQSNGLMLNLCFIQIIRQLERYLYLLIILIDYFIGVLAIKGQRETFNKTSFNGLYVVN